MTAPADIRLQGAHSGGATSPPLVSTARSIKNASTPRISVKMPDAKKNPFHIATLPGAGGRRISRPALRFARRTCVEFESSDRSVAHQHHRPLDATVCKDARCIRINRLHRYMLLDPCDRLS